MGGTIVSAETGEKAVRDRWRNRAALGLLLGVTAAAVAVAVVERRGGSSTPSLYQGPVTVPATSAGGWRAGGKGVQLTPTTAPGGVPGTTFDLRGTRNSYTFAKRSFFPSQNWGASQWLYVEWKGTASGEAIQLFVDTSPDGASFAVFSFADTTSGWISRSFDLDHPPTVHGKLNLGHVYQVRIATVDKQAHGSFAVGSLTLSSS